MNHINDAQLKINTLQFYVKFCMKNFKFYENDSYNLHCLMTSEYLKETKYTRIHGRKKRKGDTTPSLSLSTSLPTLFFRLLTVPFISHPLYFIVTHTYSLYISISLPLPYILLIKLLKLSLQVEMIQLLLTLLLRLSETVAVTLLVLYSFIYAYCPSRTGDHGPPHYLALFSS